MQLYMQEPRMAPTIQGASMEKRYSDPYPEDKPALLSKEKCIELYKVQIEIKCEATLNLVKRPAATDPEEK